MIPKQKNQTNQKKPTEHSFTCGTLVPNLFGYRRCYNFILDYGKYLITDLQNSMFLIETAQYCAAVEDSGRQWQQNLQTKGSERTDCTPR